MRKRSLDDSHGLGNTREAFTMPRVSQESVESQAEETSPPQAEETRPNRAEAPPEVGLTAGERLQLQFLRGEVKRAQNTLDYLPVANQEALNKTEEPLPHCNPKLVKKIASSIVSNLLLNKELLYPSEEVQQEALLTEFGMTSEKKDKVYEEFLMAWGGTCVRPNFRQLMNDAMRRRKGTFTKALRDELYLQIGIRKYHRGATVEERLVFNQQLQKAKLHDTWRVSSEEDETWDPWGSQAVHASISKALYGVHYIASQKISLSLDFASFIFHVLTLAMEDRNLQGNERLTLAGELTVMKGKITEWLPYMRRITIVLPVT